MTSDYSKFLEEMADRLRSLAAQAPDITHELRQHADELDRLAAEASQDSAGSEKAA
jgi:ABC-type transporter Mla subunit MlaD